MHGYKLTDRGRILVTLVFVVLFLLIPSAILLYTAMTGQSDQPPAGDSPSTSGTSPPAIVETVPPEISESPPPNGGGFNPPDVTPTNGNGAGQETSPPPGPGQPSVDPSEGTLSFFFSPNLQNTLDVETSTMLSTFLSSDKNTQDSLIAVEFPQLPGKDADKVISAVISAFAAYGVREQRLAFITDSKGAEEEPFEVRLSYIVQNIK